MFDSVNLNLSPRIFGKQNFIAFFYIQWCALSVFTNFSGPVEITLPSFGFSLALSGMMMPPAVYCSSSTRRTNTISFNGQILFSITSCFLWIDKNKFKQTHICSINSLKLCLRLLSLKNTACEVIFSDYWADNRLYYFWIYYWGWRRSGRKAF